MATRKNIGQLLVEKAMELDPTFVVDKFNDMGDALAIVLAHMGEGGKSYTAGEGITISEEGVISINVDKAEDHRF